MQEDLGTKKRDELLQLAKGLGIRGVSTAKKSQIIEAIEKQRRLITESSERSVRRAAEKKTELADADSAQREIRQARGAEPFGTERRIGFTDADTPVQSENGR